MFALQRSLLHDPERVWESINTHVSERSTYEVVFEGPPRRDVLMQRFAIGETGAMGILLHDLTAERELARAKDELVSMVSHELASPATSLVAYAGLLAEHDYSEPERQDMLATMVQEGQRLTTIIQDFLDIQRLEHGRFQLTAQPMELRPLLEHAARVAATDAEHPSNCGSAREPATRPGRPESRPTGPGEPALQCAQVHPGGRTHLADRQEDRGSDRNLGRRRRAGNPTRGAAAPVRKVLSRRY